MDTISALCVGLIAVVSIIIFFVVCLYAGDALAARFPNYDEL